MNYVLLKRMFMVFFAVLSLIVHASEDNADSPFKSNFPGTYQIRRLKKESPSGSAEISQNDERGLTLKKFKLDSDEYYHTMVTERLNEEKRKPYSQGHLPEFILYTMSTETYYLKLLEGKNDFLQ